MSLIDALPIDDRADIWPDLETPERCVCTTVSTAQSILKAAHLWELVSYWNRLRGDAEMPLRHDIDPFDLHPSLGWVMLMDRQPCGSDFTFRLVGTRVADLYGHDMTGRSVKEFSDERQVAFATDRLLEVVAERQPIATRCRRDLEDRSVLMERVDLPFADTEGRVTVVMTGVFPVARSPRQFQALMTG